MLLVRYVGSRIGGRLADPRGLIGMDPFIASSGDAGARLGVTDDE